MHKFSHPLTTGEDASTNLPVFGFILNDMLISDPFSSECGRFKVDPTETYGVSQEDAMQLVELNKLVDRATQDALNAGCLTAQNTLGIETGDAAGLFFSGSTYVRPVAQAMVDYILFEYKQAHA